MVEKGYNYWGAYEYSVPSVCTEEQRRAALKRFLGNFTSPHFIWTGGIGPEPCASWLESMVREKRSMVINVQTMEKPQIS